MLEDQTTQLTGPDAANSPTAELNVPPQGGARLNIPAEIDETTVDDATERVHFAIRSLVSDEFPDLAQNCGSQGADEGSQYLHLTLNTVKNYSKTTWKTWWGVAFSFVKIFVGGVSPIDFLISFVFSLCITIILTGGMVICLFAKIPFVIKKYDAYASRYGGVSFINIVNSGMFMNLTDEELHLATDAMSSVEAPQDHMMNIDIAKLMLLFSGLVYERSTTVKRQAIRRCSSMDWSRLLGPTRRSSLAPNHQRPFFIRHRRSLSSDTTASAEDTLPLHRPQYGTFPSDFGNWKQQFIHQSPSSSPVQTTFPSSLPRRKNTIKRTNMNFQATLDDAGIIATVLQKWGFEYEPVSELDTASSAYSAAFWDKKSNWVVVAFKGTSPPEFDEWLVDFDYTRVDVSGYVPGFSTAHHGFKNRLFPDEPTLNRTPYETIVEALKVITDDLLSRTDKGRVNVYFTGHSLGSGIASLAYSRAMQNIDGLDERVRICDAYLFSSPIASDISSAKWFNETIRSGPNGPCTTWRIVNHHDAVATLFPAMGDDPHYSYPDSLFAFAHLGTEIKMRRDGTKSIAENNYAPGSTKVCAVSGLPPEQVGKVPKAMEVPRWMIWAQYFPLAGWMFSHFPGLYMESLQAMQVGEMEWRRKHAMD